MNNDGKSCTFVSCTSSTYFQENLCIILSTSTNSRALQTLLIAYTLSITSTQGATRLGCKTCFQEKKNTNCPYNPSKDLIILEQNHQNVFIGEHGISNISKDLTLLFSHIHFFVVPFLLTFEGGCLLSLYIRLQSQNSISDINATWKHIQDGLPIYADNHHTSFYVKNESCDALTTT